MVIARSNMKQKSALATRILPAFIILGSFTHGANLYWGGDADSSFQTLANWFTDEAHSTGASAIPGAADVAVFNADGVVANSVASLGGAPVTLDGLVFNAKTTSAITVTDTAALTLGASGLSIAAGAGAHTFAAPLNLVAIQSWTNDGGLFTVSGPVTQGPANSGLTLNGTAGFAFTGLWTQNGGNRTITTNTTGPVTFAGINLSEGNTARTMTFAANTPVTVNGVIANGGTAAGNITKTGAGTLTFNSANTYSGTLNLNGGTVAVNATSAAGISPALVFGSGSGATGTLTLATGISYRTGAITVNATSGGGLVNGSGTLTLNGDRVFTVNDTAAAVDFQTDVVIANGDTTARRVTKAGAGTWVSNGANTYTNGTFLNGGVTQWNATNTNTAGGLTFDGVAAATATRLTIGGGAQFTMPGNLQFNATATAGAIIDGAGAIGLHTGDRAFIITEVAALPVEVTVNAAIANSTLEAAQNRGVRKEGLGRLILAGANTYTGSTDVTRGSLVIDYNLSNGNKIADVATATLILRGGLLLFDGSSTAPTTESVTGATIVSAGMPTLSVAANGGQTTTLNLTTFTRTAGQGLLDLQTNGASATIGTTQANLATGYIGAWATFNGDRWAANVANVVGGFGSTVQTNRSQWSAGQHIVVDAAISGATRHSQLGSLIFDFAGANTLVLNNPGTSLDLGSGGGILASRDVAANNTAISGGQIRGTGIVGAVNPEIVITNRSNGILSISADIGATNAPALAIAAVTVGGNSAEAAGSLDLSGRNFYTGATGIQGNVRVSGGNAIPDFSTVTIGNAGGTRLDLNGSTEALANLGGGNFANMNAADQVSLGTGGTLIVNSTAAHTYSGTITGSGNVIKNGPSTWTSTTAPISFTGELHLLGGILDLTGANGGATGVTRILLRGGSILSQQDQTATQDKFGNSATIRLEGTTGNGLRTTSNQPTARTESTNILELGAGSNVITLTNTAGTPTTAITTLAFTNTTDAFARFNNATLVARTGIADFGGPSATLSTRVTFASGIAGDLVGGGGTTATNISILPFAVGGVNNVANPGDTFLTVGANGLRPLAITGEYATGYGAAAANDNLTQSASASSLATKTLNALRVDNSAANVDLAGVGGGSNTLTLTSGALLISAGANLNDTIISGYDSILAGANDATPDELVIHVTSSNAAPAGATLTLSSPLANNGAAASLTKSGAGTLVLGAAGSYSGTTTVNQGVVSFTAANQLGADGPIRVAGGTLQWGAGNTADISTKSDTTARSLELLGQSSWIGRGSLILTGSTFDVGVNNVTLANPIGAGGNGGLTKIGAGKLTLSASPSYTGATVVSAGDIEFAGGIAANTTSALYLIAPSGTQNATVANGLNVQSLVVGGIYSGTANSTSTLTVTGGAVNIGDGTGDDFFAVAFRDTTSGNGAAGTHSAHANFSAATSVNINVSTVILGTNSPAGGSNSTDGDLTLSNGTNTITASLVQAGNSPSPGNTAVASAIATGTGPTTINANSIVLGGQKSNGSLSVGLGGTLTIRGTAGGTSAANVLVGSNDASGTGAISSLAQTKLDISAGTADLKINQLVLGRHHSGAGGGQGQLLFSAGTVEAATIEMGISDFLGASTADANSIGQIVQGGGTLRFGTITKGNGGAVYTMNSGTIANLAGFDAQNVNVPISLDTAGTHTVNVEAGQRMTFETAAGFSGAGTLAKLGDGSLILNGTNSHAGATSVDAGTLLVHGSITGSAVTVNNGGTLGGNGSITAAVTVNSGGIIAPGASAGQLDTGDLTLAAGSAFSVELGGLTAATQYDQLNVTGGITLGGALGISLINAFTPGAGDLFWIGLNDGTDDITGTFSNVPITDALAKSGGVTFGGIDYTVYYGADSTTNALTGGNDILVVPEPGSAVLLLGGLALLAGRRRRTNDR